MEVALVLMVIAAAVFVADFARGLPGYNLTAVGLAFAAISLAVYIYEVGIK